MGQRLNLEITTNGNVLANAYYRWSGCTSTALKVSENALKKFEKGKKTTIELYEMALDMLENTGAKFTNEELCAWNEYTFQSIFGYSLPKKDRNSDGVNKNKGIISITSMGINETRKWEEARVQIDIENQTINFKVYCEITKKQLEEDYETKIEDLKEIKYNFSEIPFDKFEDFSKKILDIIEKEDYNCISNGKIYSFIISTHTPLAGRDQ